MSEHPKAVMMRWLQTRRIGEVISVNDLGDVVPAAQLTPKMRASFGHWLSPWIYQTAQSVPSITPSAKGRRVSRYIVVGRPTEDEVKAAASGGGTAR